MPVAPEPTSTPSLVVLGAHPSSSKTVVCVGLLRWLANHGCRAAPFKALAVAGSQTDDPTNVLAHHLAAARLDETEDCVPVVVVPRRSGRGELFVQGRYVTKVAISGRDTVVVTDLSERHRLQLLDVIKNSLTRLVQEYDTIIVEGAGSAVEQDPNYDIANIFVARSLASPILLAARASSGMCVPSLFGTIELLPRDVREQVRGIFLSDVVHEASARYSADLLQKKTGVPVLGRAPHVKLWDEYPTTPNERDDAYECWARLVDDEIGAHHLWATLLPMFVGARTTPASSATHPSHGVNEQRGDVLCGD